MRNIYDALALPVRQMTVHNCYLLSVEPDAYGWEKMTVEIDGVKGVVIGSSKYSELSSGTCIGQWGFLQTVNKFRNDVPTGSTRFVAYIDQTLRRFPAIDQPGQLGWTCEFSGHEFLAPENIIPGERGRFIPDETEDIIIQIPPEFVWVAKLVQLSPENLLRGFIADVSEVHNFCSLPRADEYSSNGSDERELAQEWLRRAYGHNEIEPAELEKREEEQEQYDDARDELSAILDEWVADGHGHEELLNAVREIANSKQNESEGLPKS